MPEDPELRQLREFSVQQSAREEQQLTTLTQTLDETRQAIIGTSPDEMTLRQLELMAIQRATAEIVHRSTQETIRAMDAELNR